MVLGIFFKREDAIRFARRECGELASHMLVVEGDDVSGLFARQAA